MNLISFKKLNLKNKMRIVNLISQYYPYEDIGEIYGFFLNDLKSKKNNYFITSIKRKLYGIGFCKSKKSLLYWPLIPLDKKYFGNHKTPKCECKEEYKANYENFLNTVLEKNKTYAIILSNYGIENIIADIFIKKLSYNKYLSSHTDYYGDAAKYFKSISNDRLNYKNASPELKSIRNNFEERIYVYTNRTL